MQPLHRRFTRSHAYPYRLLVGRKGIAALPNGHFHISPCLALPASEEGFYKEASPGALFCGTAPMQS